jgi:hypothetical protein
MVHCPKKGGGFLAVAAAVGAVTLVAVVVGWLTANWPLVLALALALAVTAGGVVWVSRWSARVSLVSGPLAWRLAGYRPAVQVQAEVQPRAALRAVPLPIGAPRATLDVARDARVFKEA